jgi:4-hydroxyphenylpyruvate dioxygenase
MKIDHVQFYVSDAIAWRDWFVNVWGFQSVAHLRYPRHDTVAVQSGGICFAISSPTHPDSAIARYLRQHPPGIVDIALQVSALDVTIQRAIHQGALLLHPIRHHMQSLGKMSWAQIQGWGNLRHTLVERQGATPVLPPSSQERSHPEPVYPSRSLPLTGIDHVVLNVPKGELGNAVTWYSEVLGFQPQQRFSIHTKYSGLCSQVLVHPHGPIQLPINEPTSATSQIQEFLDANGGSGIQHLALETTDIVATIAQLAERGVSFLSVPSMYYEQLAQRCKGWLSATTLQAIAQSGILVDWQPDWSDGVLLQTFTQPIFPQPTFFFEIIQRRWQEGDRTYPTAKGFGEGNFQALFEAIEREQQKRCFDPQRS